MIKQNVRWILFLGLLITLASCSGAGSVGSGPVLLPETQEPTEAGLSTGLSWDSPPEMTIDPEDIYQAVLVTEKGDVRVELFADKAPVTVNNFIFLARAGYYDGITFHRVLADFMAQSGDPTGTGGGGPGYVFEDEITHGLLFDQEGLLAMANAGPGTNGSQFFITFGPTPWLNGLHTIFGKVLEGMDVLRSLSLRDPNENPDFEGDRLITVEIEQVTRSQIPTPTAMPEAIVPIPEEGRPLAALPPAERAGLYTGLPELVIDLNKTYTANIDTSKGRIEIKLEPLSAPQSVNNFVVLARLGYWDDFPINSVQDSAFILTGSPAGRPDSDIGYLLPSENGSPATAGALGYWFRQDLLASSGSQIFIVLGNLEGMEEFFTIFGYVTSGLENAQALTVEDRITRITILEE
jgi:cyclophilin family peptidyl-prolyl cis-trans isomerase